MKQFWDSRVKVIFRILHSVSKGNVEIMFVVPQGEVNDYEGEEDKQEFFPKPLMTGGLFIVTDEVDGLWVSVKDRAIVKTAIEDRAFLMRDFSILDNNGYELVFGQDISDR
jgi:hypothetical protein